MMACGQTEEEVFRPALQSFASPAEPTKGRALAHLNGHKSSINASHCQTIELTYLNQLRVTSGREITGFRSGRRAAFR